MFQNSSKISRGKSIVEIFVELLSCSDDRHGKLQNHEDEIDTSLKPVFSSSSRLHIYESRSPKVAIIDRFTDFLQIWYIQTFISAIHIASY